MLPQSPLQLARNGKGARLLVEVFPPQPENFTLAQAQDRCDQPARWLARRLRCIEQRPDLVKGVRLDARFGVSSASGLSQDSA